MGKSGHANVIRQLQEDLNSVDRRLFLTGQENIDRSEKHLRRRKNAPTKKIRVDQTPNERTMNEQIYLWIPVGQNERIYERINFS